MNKFQQALSALRQCEKYFVRHMFSKNEKRKLTIDGHITETIMTDILSELVDKATPLKPLKENTIAFETTGYDSNNMPKGKVVEEQISKCPKCHKKLVSIKNRTTKEQNHQFCPACGQAIDNSDLDSMR